MTFLRISRRNAIRLNAIGQAGAIFIASFTFGLCCMSKFGQKIAFNNSSSLPGFVYFTTSEVSFNPKYLEIVVFTPPKNPIYDSKRGFLKRVLGVPGDRIKTIGNKVLINGVEIAEVARVSKRVKFPLYPIKDVIIPEGFYYVGSHVKEGFDSRYDVIGLIPGDRIRGRGYRIF